MGTLRKLLIGMVIVGSLAGMSESGTFASFNASTTNAGTFDTAALALTTDQNNDSATTCLSTGGATNFSNNNNNTSCSEVLVPASTTRTPSGTAVAFNVKLTNSGDVTANGVKFYFSTPCTTTNDAGTVHGPVTVAGGTGDLCAGMRISVSETSATFVESACRYDADNAGSTCTVTTAPTVYTASTNLGSVATAQTLTGTLTTATPRYFKVQLLFPDGGTSGGENQYMGKQASFAIAWLLEQ